MSDLIAEVDEALRRERLEKLWKQYGNYLIAFLLALVLGTGFFSAYASWEKGEKAEQTGRLMALIEDSAFPTNLTAEIDLRPGLRGVALLAAGSVSIDQNKMTEALGYYTQAAQDQDIPDDLRHLATLMRVRLLQQQKDTSQDQQALLKQVWQDRKSPWRAHALMESAALYAQEQKDLTQARAHLAMIIGDQMVVPETVLAKARALDHVYALRQNSSTAAGNTQ